MSYLKDLPCETCRTKIIYHFPDKSTEKYCYCSFRDEIGEQIARENAEELDKEVAKAVLDNGLIDDYRNGYIRGLRKAQDLQAAIARGNK